MDRSEAANTFVCNAASYKGKDPWELALRAKGPLRSFS